MVENDQKIEFEKNILDIIMKIHMEFPELSKYISMQTAGNARKHILEYKFDIQLTNLVFRNIGILWILFCTEYATICS
jgi:hypothetical protein